MNWEDVIKRKQSEELTDEIDFDFTALSAWGKLFWEMGGIDNTDISQLWRYVEKPYNWQPEYALANALMEAIDEDDLGGLEEYMHENGLYFFDQEKIKKHIQQLKEG